MLYESFVNSLNSLKSGAFFRLEYGTNCRLTETAKKAGIIAINKITKMTVRTGCSYSHLKPVRASLEVKRDPIPNATTPNSWSHWVQKNRVREHNTTRQQYLVVYPCKSGTNTEIRYRVTYANQLYPSFINSDRMDELNYVKKNKTSTVGGPVFNVNIDNVISINGTPVWHDRCVTPITEKEKEIKSKQMIAAVAASLIANGGEKNT